MGGAATTDRDVINLSNKVLSTSQINLLQRGLKFVPSRKNIDFTQLLTDLQAWERRMRLREYFYIHKF